MQTPFAKYFHDTGMMNPRAFDLHRKWLFQAVIDNKTAVTKAKFEEMLNSSESRKVMTVTVRCVSSFGESQVLFHYTYEIK